MFIYTQIDVVQLTRFTFEEKKGSYVWVPFSYFNVTSLKIKNGKDLPLYSLI